MGLWAWLSNSQAEEVYSETIGDTAENMTANAKAVAATEWLAATGLKEEAIKNTLEQTEGDGSRSIKVNISEIKSKYR